MKNRIINNEMCAAIPSLSMLDLIGNTPILNLRQFNANLNCNLYVTNEQSLFLCLEGRLRTLKRQALSGGFKLVGNYRGVAQPG